MRVRKDFGWMGFAGLLLSLLLTGCATHEPYHGPISNYLVGGNISRPAKPLPVQLFVKSTETEDPGTRNDLLNVFVLNLKQTGKFAEVVPVGAPANPALKRLDADIALKMIVSNKTSPFYVMSWGCIFPMFMHGNKITADGYMTAVIRDDQSMLKTYSSHKTTTTGRNSVGLAWIRFETRSMERWSRATLTALFDDLISQITNDTETYRKIVAAPAP